MIEPDYERDRVRLYCGDCRNVLPHIEPVATVICDPPAGIGFMCKSWDHDKGGRDAWIAWLRGVFEVVPLLPGGHALVWALPRTAHWTATAVEDAGLIIRDKIYHLFGQGFPKSLDISKAIDKAKGAEREVVGEGAPCGMLRNGRSDPQMAGQWSDSNRKPNLITAPATAAAALWDGWGTALKPGAEEWVLAMKPLAGTFASNAERRGVAGLDIDGARIGTTRDVPASKSRHNDSRCHGTYGIERDGTSGFDPNIGRWPANVVLDEAAGAMLDEQSGEGGNGYRPNPSHDSDAGSNTWALGRTKRGPRGHDDSGGASRFFYCPKASRGEREAGLEDSPSASNVRNDHPTVKPVTLMEYFCTLTATPTGGTVLDPFAGSGATIKAAIRMMRPAIGIERDPHYFHDILVPGVDACLDAMRDEMALFTQSEIGS